MLPVQAPTILAGGVVTATAGKLLFIMSELAAQPEIKPTTPRMINLRIGYSLLSAKLITCEEMPSMALADFTRCAHLQESPEQLLTLLSLLVLIQLRDDLWFPLRYQVQR